MSTYVCLFNFTDEGIRNYRDTTHRAADFAKLVENNGGRVREEVWTVGEYESSAGPVEGRIVRLLFRQVT
jgi:uncharacterized protein with GYD domain